MSTLPIQFDFFAPKMLPQPDEAMLPVIFHQANYFIKYCFSLCTVYRLKRLNCMRLHIFLLTFALIIGNLFNSSDLVWKKNLLNMNQFIRFIDFA